MRNNDIHTKAGILLHDANQRYTEGRKRLIETLYNSGRPVSVHEILNLEPNLPQSSIYRNLDALEQSKVIDRITFKSGVFYELSESFLGHHHHMVCLSCDSVIDVELSTTDEKAIDRILGNTSRMHNFVPTHHTLDIQGFCELCLSRIEEETASGDEEL